MPVKIGNRLVDEGQPIFVTAEIGINHNGSIEIAKKLIDVAVDAGCDAVKFQKRNPDVAVPEAQKMVMRETPWGVIPYIDYKKRIEFGQAEYTEINQYCKKKDILWLASCWDVDSIEFMSQFDLPAHKVASACITDYALLRVIAETGLPVILSTGMSTQEEVDSAIDMFDRRKLILCHSVSSYPAPIEELNLRVVSNYRERYPDLVIGYSGHEVGLTATYTAVALGAAFVERHITLDRAMWGTDQAASIEPHGLQTLVRKIDGVRKSLGNGLKEVAPSERDVRKKLRRVQ